MYIYPSITTVKRHVICLYMKHLTHMNKSRIPNWHKSKTYPTYWKEHLYLIITSWVEKSDVEHSETVDRISSINTNKINQISQSRCQLMLTVKSADIADFLLIPFVYLVHSHIYLWFGSICSTIACRYKQSTSIIEMKCSDNIDFLSDWTRKCRISYRYVYRFSGWY